MTLKSLVKLINKSILEYLPGKSISVSKIGVYKISSPNIGYRKTEQLFCNGIGTYSLYTFTVCICFFIYVVWPFFIRFRSGTYGFQFLFYHFILHQLNLIPFHPSFFRSVARLNSIHWTVNNLWNSGLY